MKISILKMCIFLGKKIICFHPCSLFLFFYIATSFHFMYVVSDKTIYQYLVMIMQ